ncbi:Hypothetical predicted protein [Cloeon dipterum]|uniref:Uncharacterized protein n=1 Tax=Cloeon dipterum TaxID=197152 RepID=A0A8S1DP14_9INSE|nr:Hypothetical predicted protein [Cloeon dipterum]
MKIKEVLEETFRPVWVPITAVSRFKIYQSACESFNKITLAFCSLSFVQFILLWLIAHLKQFFVEGSGLHSKMPSLPKRAIDFFLTASILPTTFVSLGFVLFYMSLAYFAICLLNHLHQVLLILHHPHYLELMDEHYDDAVNLVLRYAHQMHLRTIYYIDGINGIFSNAILLQSIILLIVQCTLAFHVSSADQQNTDIKLTLLQSILILNLAFIALSALSSEISSKGKKLQEA